MHPVPLARATIGTTLGLHILFATSALSLPLFLGVAEYLGLRRHDPEYLQLAAKAGRSFAVVFAAGTVTGTLVAAQLAMVWAPFMTLASQVIILPFFIEGFAFLLESACIGAYLYGFRRTRRPWRHFLLTIPIAVASAASGLLITVVNSWMNAPAGFVLVGGRVVSVSPWQAMFQPGMWVQNSHVLVTGYSMGAMLLLSVAAWVRLRRPRDPAARKGGQLAAAIALPSLVLSVATGHLSAVWIAHHQPEKLAAMEALFRTTRHAPLVVGGIVDQGHAAVRGAFTWPGLLSLLAFGRASHAVMGLDRVPRSLWPPVAWVHATFDLMVLLGGGMIALTALYLRYGRVPQPPRWLLLAAVAGGPAAMAAVECGWLTDELGRQPWLIYHRVLVPSGVTRAPGVTPLDLAVVALLMGIFAAVPAVILRSLSGYQLAGLSDEEGTAP